MQRTNKKLACLCLGLLFALLFVAGGCDHARPQAQKKLPAITAKKDWTPEEKLRMEYIQVIGESVRNNWAMPIKFVGKDLEAEIVFTVHPDGSLKDIWFEKRSDSREFDRSVEKAVKKSNPAPPFPEALDKAPFEMMVRFTPPKR